MSTKELIDICAKLGFTLEASCEEHIIVEYKGYTEVFHTENDKKFKHAIATYKDMVKFIEKCGRYRILNILDDPLRQIKEPNFIH